MPDLRIAGEVAASTAYESLAYPSVATHFSIEDVAHLVLPGWAAVLEQGERAEMAGELLAARATPTQFLEIMEDWRATAEARTNRGLVAHLARTDRTYVPWI